MNLIKRASVSFLCVTMIGCASVPPGSEPSPHDPWESFNRSIFAFNEGLDEYLLKPVTKGYRFVLPKPAQQGIDNFFGNYRDIYTSANNLLQGNFSMAFSDLMRVVVNTIFGLGGFIDMATPGGLEKHKADFEIGRAHV